MVELVENHVRGHVKCKLGEWDIKVTHISKKAQNMIKINPSSF